MLISGLSLPEMASLNVLSSGLFAIAWEPVCSAIESMEPGPVGTSLRYLSQPGPCGSGTFVDVGTGVLLVVASAGSAVVVAVAEVVGVVVSGSA